jgi:hypothetical protein
MRTKVKYPWFRTFAKQYLLKLIFALILIELVVIAYFQNRNQHPVAQDDEATVALGGIADIPVLVNDSDKDTEDKLALETVSKPEHGEATIRSRIIRYTPEQGFVGTDCFTYTITDGKDSSKPATVTVTVQADPKS